MAYPNKWFGQMVSGVNILYFDERISEQFKSNIFVFSDSVLCIGGKCPDHPEAATLLKTDRIKYFVESPEYRPIYDLTGELVEVVWKIYVGRSSTDILEYIQKMLEEGVQPSHFKGMSMYNDIRWWQTKNENVCHLNAFLGLGNEENGTET